MQGLNPVNRRPVPRKNSILVILYALTSFGKWAVSQGLAIFSAWKYRKPTVYDSSWTEYCFVLTGHGTAVLDGQEYPLEAGDFLRLPPGTSHGFITGDQPLEMRNVHAPGCRPDRDTYFVSVVVGGFFRGNVRVAASTLGAP